MAAHLLLVPREQLDVLVAERQVLGRERPRLLARGHLQPANGSQSPANGSQSPAPAPAPAQRDDDREAEGYDRQQA
eukprot:COSAG01_NODE_6801_length_3493_cov_4.260165_2_plen_76_part_00